MIHFFRFIFSGSRFRERKQKLAIMNDFLIINTLPIMNDLTINPLVPGVH